MMDRLRLDLTDEFCTFVKIPKEYLPAWMRDDDAGKAFKKFVRKQVNDGIEMIDKKIMSAE